MARQKKRRKLPVNYLDILYVPKETLSFHEDSNGLIVLDVENTGFFNGLAQRFFHRPRVSHVSLDRYGSVLWRQLDGTHSVGDIVEEMKAFFPDEEERMLERCVHFLSVLDQNHFIRRR